MPDHLDGLGAVVGNRDLDAKALRISLTTSWLISLSSTSNTSVPAMAARSGVEAAAP
jgi:hypothetical protein